MLNVKITIWYQINTTHLNQPSVRMMISPYCVNKGTLVGMIAHVLRDSVLNLTPSSVGRQV